MNATGLRCFAMAGCLAVTVLARSAEPTAPTPSKPSIVPSPIVVSPGTGPANAGTDPLAFDSQFKEFTAGVTVTNAHFTFSLTNVSSAEVVISNVRTSCGCTVASLPSKPWRLIPGANGQIGASVDLRGKFGTLVKSLFVDYAVGT